MLFKRTLSSGKKCQTWTARYRGADGCVIQRPTGCRGKDAAQARLSEWLKEEERTRSGVVTSSEVAAVKWARVLLTQHIEDYKAHLKSRDVHPNTVKTRGYYLNAVLTECHFRRFAEVSRSKVERWLLDQVRNEGMGLRSHNAYVVACIAFGNWAVRQGRLLANPFAGLRKQNEQVDRRRPRRALTQEELVRLFESATNRPLQEALYCPVRTGKKGKSRIPDKPHDLDPATIDSLQWLGRVRSMAYKTMAYTGLRLGECLSLTLGEVHLTSDTPYLELQAEHEKSRRGAQLPLPMFFVEDMRQYIHERRKRLVGDGKAFRGMLENVPLFDLPKVMGKVFDRDLVYAGLATKVENKDGRKRVLKKNDRGESVDIHCLRHTFITNLALSGASMIETAKAARHTDPKITLKVYSHVSLSELSAAVSMIPGPKVNTQVQAVNCGHEKVSLKMSPKDCFSMQQSATNCNVAIKDVNGQTYVSPNKHGGLRGKEWRAQQDSNLRPLAPEASALSN
jgi:integrase